MDIFDLHGKTALITGASSGLGARFAHVLAKAGARVILTARRLDKLETIANEIRRKGFDAVPIIMNVAQKKSVQKVISKLTTQGEKIDILVNNAGIAKFTPIFELDTQNNFESIMQTNVMGIWYVTQFMAMHMKDNSIKGSIINIASINGTTKLGKNITGYCVSKAAVIQLTKALVGELSEAKIRINCIVPGLFPTPLTDSYLSILENRQVITNVIPLNFVATLSDLDGIILYLSSNKASRYVTGSSITVDGGMSWGG